MLLILTRDRNYSRIISYCNNTYLNHMYCNHACFNHVCIDFIEPKYMVHKRLIYFGDFMCFILEAGRRCPIGIGTNFHKNINNQIFYTGDITEFNTGISI